MTLDLDEVEKACAAARPGPWRAELGGYAVSYPECAEDFSELLGREEVTVLEGDGGSIGKMKDGAFIAGARSWVPELVAEVRRLRAVLGGLVDAVHCEAASGISGRLGAQAFRARRMLSESHDVAAGSERVKALEEAAFEKAAKVAEAHDSSLANLGGGVYEGMLKRCGQEIAAAIRALGAK